MLIAEHSMCQPGRPGPIAVSQDGSPGLRALPEREVADVVLAVLVGLDPLPHPQLVRVEAGQPPVGRPRGDPEEDRAVVGPVGVAALEQRPDERDDLVDVARSPAAGRPGVVIRRRAASARKRSQVPLGERPRWSRRSAAAPRMILSSMSVMFITQVTGVATPAQVADEQVREQERAEVADVGRSVDGRAAGVDAGPDPARSGTNGRVSPDRVSCSRSVIAPRLERRDGTSAEIARPAALGAVEVAASTPSR